MTHVVNNGRRAEVAHALYAGTAGVVEDGSQTLVSFQLKGPKLPDGPITLDGEPYLIVSARKSATTPNMVVLAVSAVNAEAPQP